MKCIAPFLCMLLLSGGYSEENLLSIAVMELSGNNINIADLQGLTNRLRTELFATGKFQVIERSQMEEILKEQGFQQTGCTNAQCAVEMGQLIGVRKMVLGSIDKVAGIYSVNIRMVNVETGEIERTALQDCDGCDLGVVLRTSLKKAARKIAGIEEEGTLPVEKPTVPVTTVAPDTEIQKPPAQVPRAPSRPCEGRLELSAAFLRGYRYSYDCARPRAAFQSWSGAIDPQFSTLLASRPSSRPLLASAKSIQSTGRILGWLSAAMLVPIIIDPERTEFQTLAIIAVPVWASGTILRSRSVKKIREAVELFNGE